MEHPDITFYNLHGYLPDQNPRLHKEIEPVAQCSMCDEDIYKLTDKVIKYGNYYFCDKVCLVEAYECNLITHEDLQECF